MSNLRPSPLGVALLCASAISAPGIAQAAQSGRQIEEVVVTAGVREGLQLVLLAVAQLALTFARSALTRAAIGITFAAPAAVAGYHAVHGIAAATMPQSAWQLVVSLIGAIMIASASWTQWSRACQ